MSVICIKKGLLYKDIKLSYAQALINNPSVYTHITNCYCQVVDKFVYQIHIYKIYYYSCIS